MRDRRRLLQSCFGAQACKAFEHDFLMRDRQFTGVWGTGDLSDKPVGFTDVRAKVSFEADRPRAELEALVAHAHVWSPVANTFTRPVNLEVSLA
jgi:organic hydroperoxide reductase OsmC/OhrA